MLVVIDDAVFAQGSPCQVVALIRHGETGRHSIVVESEAGPAFMSWLDRQADELREWVRFVLDSNQRELALRDKRRVRVVAGHAAHWSADPPMLPLAVALQFLERPVHVLVENKRNDGAFVRAFATAEYRKALRKAEADRWVEFEQGGGITELIQEIPRLRQDPLRRLSTFVVFDSDALCTGHLSRDSKKLGNLCKTRKHPVCHHQLSRRSMENFLPREALKKWADCGKGNEQRQRRTRLDAYNRLQTNEQRYHFNMKSGFSEPRDADYLANKSGIYASLAPLEREYLKPGFANDIGDLYHQTSFTLEPAWFYQDDQLTESTQLYEKLFSLI